MAWCFSRKRSLSMIYHLFIEPSVFPTHLVGKPCTKLHKSFNTSSTVPGVLYARRGKNIVNNFVEEDDHAEWYVPEVEDERRVEDMASMSDQQKMNKLTEEMRMKERKRMFVKNKVIERKHFRPLPAANILTSRAQEQIRYIYSIDPNEGGIESILQTFPVTEKDLEVFLKRKQKIFKNQVDIVRHDASVYNKWILLAESSNLNASLQLTLTRLIDSGQIDKLKNAAGADGVPRLSTPTLEELAHQAPKIPGKLTSLLKKHGSFSLQHLPATDNSQLQTHQSVKAVVEPSLDDVCSGPPTETNPHSLLGKIIARYKPKR